MPINWKDSYDVFKPHLLGNENILWAGKSKRNWYSRFKNLPSFTVGVLGIVGTFAVLSADHLCHSYQAGSVLPLKIDHKAKGQTPEYRDY